MKNTVLVIGVVLLVAGAWWLGRQQAQPETGPWTQYQQQPPQQAQQQLKPYDGPYEPIAQQQPNPFDQFDPPPPAGYVVDQSEIDRLNAKRAQDAMLYEQRRANEIARRQVHAIEEQTLRQSHDAAEARAQQRRAERLRE